MKRKVMSLYYILNSHHILKVFFSLNSNYILKNGSSPLNLTKSVKKITYELSSII